MNMQSKHPASSVRDQKRCDARPSVPAKTRYAKPFHESADSYTGVIAKLDARHRVILCRDAIQWIIQKKRGQGRRQGNWRAKSYITCPKALIKASDALCGPLNSETIAILQALPSNPGGKR